MRYSLQMCENTTILCPGCMADTVTINVPVVVVVHTPSAGSIPAGVGTPHTLWVGARRPGWEV